MRNGWLWLWFLALATGGCSTDPPPPPVAVALAVVTDPSAAAQNGVPLPVQPVVELRGADGQPVLTRGVLVNAEIGTGGGTLTGATSLRTDAEGRVYFTDLTLVGLAGPRTLRFTGAGLIAAVSSTIALSAGVAATVQAAAGISQTAAAGTPVPEPPAVLVRDAAGNPVTGVDVTFLVTEGGGSLAATEVTTGLDGVAALPGWTLGPVAGVNRLIASVGTQEVLFTATGVVGPPARIVVEAGSGQSGVVAQAVPVLPRVLVTDAFDNPVAGVTVTFAVATGGGTLIGPTPTTDAAGVAELGTWILGFLPGLQTVTASRSPAPPATFTATAADFQTSSVAAGGRASCGVAASGSALCWGANAAGQLGTGTIGDSASRPTPVTGGGQVQLLAIGTGHTCGLTSSGVARCWGDNSNGQLGDGTRIASTIPVAVKSNLTFTRIVAGDTHTCALDQAGAAWCWGGNANGRLGDGTTTLRTVPTAVVGGHRFVTISAGTAHTCAVRSDGQALCWGSNGSGRLGDGTTIQRPAPAQVLMPLGVTAFATITAGGGHSCAVDVAGLGFCWGVGSQGALGTGNTGAQVAPAPVAGGLTFTTIVAGVQHTCGLADAGAVYCWGANGGGRLGDGTFVTRTSPVPVARAITATALALGDEHTCARTTFGSALCWGRGQEGQVGDDTNLSRTEPTGVTPP